jgi:hypothetical protein
VEKVATNIEYLLSRKKPGEILFISDFRGMGVETAIRKSLSRLTKSGKLSRVAQGIYYLPKTDPLLGELHPSAEQVAQKVAEKEKVRIFPTGVAALNRLGLSTQVPTKLVYLTDGVPRLLTIGKMQVRFKATTPKRMALKGPVSRLVILALEELDLKQLDSEMDQKLRGLLQLEHPQKLKHDLQLAPGRIHDYIVKLLKTPSDDRMAPANG